MLCEVRCRLVFGKDPVLVEGKGVEVVEKIHVLHIDVFGHLDARGGEIQDGGDARVHQMGGSPLGSFRRCCDNANLDIVFGHNGGHFLCAMHFEPMHNLADLEGIAVEYGYDIETAFLEVRVVQQGLAEIAHANESHAPFAIYIQGRSDGLNERGDIVAHATYAKFAKIGQILADLGAIDAAGLGQWGGGYDFGSVSGEIFKNLDIGSKALNGCSGDASCFGRCFHITNIRRGPHAGESAFLLFLSFVWVTCRPPIAA